MLLYALGAALVAFAGVVVAARIASERRARQVVAAARAEADAAIRSARLEAAAIRRAAETAARERALVLRHEADDDERAAVESLARARERLAGAAASAERTQEQLADRAAALDGRQRAITSLRDRAHGLRRDASRLRDQARATLEERARTTFADVEAALVARRVEAARAEAAQRVRAVDQMSGQMSGQVSGPAHGASDLRSDRDARRIMDIAISRYQNHFLTERNISRIPVVEAVSELLLADGGAILEVLQEVANVGLHVADDGAEVKLDGLDGVGREIARRALSRLSKKPSAVAECKADPRAWATGLRAALEREIQSLGKRAFSVLAIPRSHPEIVALVGALNYRTSYTQNQWLHAVEASFLAGVMASELGLDIKLARRATLMHDIGKALTHKIEGSHAVIGADIARRLGEDEVVANAIGAHHADEPPGSIYAYLVAAADAMSGARPGARREMAEGFTSRVDDLERIGVRYRGVDRAHAVHGGRELRVYVDEGRVDDLGVVSLSSEIAEQISEEMTFPGQIKVTVIRAFEAVSTAN